MVKLLKRRARLLLEEASGYHPRHRTALHQSRVERAAGSPKTCTPAREHLDQAILWLKRAQEAAGGGGVAWGYRARVPVRSNDQLGWISAYPETTGYIIPTMSRYATVANDTASAEAARKMADWELSIQLEDGGFQGGIYGSTPVASSTFVTGQVLFGLVDAYDVWRNESYRKAAVRAGDFLVSCLSDDGRFVDGYSHFCEAGPKAYEVRTGLALAQLGIMENTEVYKAAACRIAEYTLSCQRENGWFAENDLDYHDVPLTHTIGYTLEGLHGIGKLLDVPECIQAVERTLQSITSLVPDNGFLPGRWRNDWTPAVDWSCLTGTAQIAGIYLRMYRDFGNPVHFDIGRKLLGFVSWTQSVVCQEPALSGGVRGSYPFDGGYGRWCVLNWATKFFADSVMDYLALADAQSGRS